MVLACRFWFGMSKKDWPPSPCNSTFAPMVPFPLVAAAPGTPDAGKNWSAGAAILKRIGRPLVDVSYNPRILVIRGTYLTITMSSKIMPPSCACDIPMGIFIACWNAVCFC